MVEPLENTWRRIEAFKLGWARGLHGLEPQPLASEYPLDKRHQDYVKGYQAGRQECAAHGQKEQLAHAWAPQPESDSD